MAGNLLVATGFAREARVVRGAGVVAIPGGNDADALDAALRRHAADAAAILSFGFCGALDPALRVGDWLIGTRLIGAREQATDPRWVEQLQARLPAARRGAFYADGQMVTLAADKRQLFLSIGASAVDMESHVAARVAANHRLPFAILRLVSDEASRDLPPAIAVSMRHDGGLAWGAVLGSLMRHPGQVGGLVRTLAGFARADRILQQQKGKPIPWTR